MRARHRVNGSYVSADEAVLRRLGREWEIVPESDEQKPAAPRRRASSAKKKPGSKSGDK